jgi:TolA-binding protein
MDPAQRQQAQGPHDDLQALMQFASKHGARIGLAVSVVLIIAAATVLYQSRQKRKVEQAVQMLASSRTTEDLDKLLTDYPSSEVAPLAMLKLAKEYFNSRNFDMSLDKYTQIMQKFPDHSLAPAAQLGKIHCLEARGQLEDALDAFAAFSEKYPDHFLTSQALLGHARCLEQLGRHREAKAAYEDFIAAYPESGWSSSAEDFLAALDKQLGETSSAHGPSVTD